MKDRLHHLIKQNNPYFSHYLHLIYTSELQIKDTTDTKKTASFLDLYLNIDRWMTSH